MRDAPQVGTVARKPQQQCGNSGTEAAAATRDQRQGSRGSSAWPQICLALHFRFLSWLRLLYRRSTVSRLRLQWVVEALAALGSLMRNEREPPVHYVSRFFLINCGGVFTFSPPSVFVFGPSPLSVPVQVSSSRSSSWVFASPLVRSLLSRHHVDGAGGGPVHPWPLVAVFLEHRHSPRRSKTGVFCVAR